MSIGTISRRAFMATTTATLALGALSQNAFAQETPKRGGDLSIAVHGASTSDNFDPRTFNSQYTAVLAGTVFNTLLEIEGAEGKLIPGIATSWESSEAGKVWTLELAQNVKFHNGADMTATDVIYSFKIHGEEGTRSNSQQIVGAIETLEAPDPYTLVITLKEANQFFPALLTNYSLVIVPDGTTDFDGTGTGAYKVTSFAPGEILETTRFDDYFKADKAHVDTVAIVAVNDSAARVSAIQTGQVQIATELDPRSVPLLDALPTLDVVFLKGAGFMGYNMMLDKPPFDNAKLRLAMKYAIDREDIINRVYNGYARLGNDTPVPPNSPDFARDIEQYSYDPEKARALYEESGHTGPIVLQTSDAAGSAAVDAAALIKEHAVKAGIEIEIKREPADGFWGNVWAQTPFHATVWGARASSEMILSLAYASGSPANDTAFKDPEFDAALAKARVSETVEGQRAALAEAQEILHDRGGALIPAFPDIPEGVASNLRGYIPGTILVGSLRAAESVWFD